MRAYLALLLAISGTAWSAIFVRWAGVPGAPSGFYRTLTAALVLVPWRLMRRGRPMPDAPSMILAIGGGAFFAADLALYNTAVLRTTAATAALLGNLTPVFVGLMTWMWMRRRPALSFWIGLAFALAGCTAIVGADAFRRHAETASVEGDVLALLAAVFFAAYLMVTERVRTAMDTLTFNTLAIVGSTATLLIVSAIRRDPLGGYGAHAWLALIALGLISQLGAYLALVYALGHLPATVTSVGLLAQVPLTAVLAMLLLDEPLSIAQIAGGAVVLAGIYVVGGGTREERTSELPRDVNLHAAPARRFRMDNQTGGDRTRDQGGEGGQREGSFGQQPGGPTGTSGRDADLQKEGNLGNERNRGNKENQSDMDEESGQGNRPSQNR